jgi:mRNA-degrading endonuclease YafQ of YafQ-DinJ toxin-antitoxin module
MRELVLTPKFRRAFHRYVQRSPWLRRQIEAALRQMQADVFVPALGSHKLSGRLSGLWAYSCGHGCRIVFLTERDLEGGQEVIGLLDIGTHDEVY